MVIHRAEVDFGAYNLLVDFDGTVQEYVPFQDKAAHARFFNGNSVGVAVRGDFATAEPGRHSHPTAAQLESLEQLCRNLVWWFGGPKVVGHTELGPDATTFSSKSQGTGHECPGGNLDLEALRKAIGQ